MESFRKLNSVCDEINKIGYSSYTLLHRAKVMGVLDSFIDTELLNELRSETIFFLNGLFTKETYNYKKIVLENCLKPILSFHAEYMLCEYFNCVDAYRNVPNLLKALIERLDIREYKNISIDELYKIITDTFDTKENNDYLELIYKYPCLYTNYSDYDGIYRPDVVSSIAKNEFFVWSEKRTYDEEQALLNNTGYLNRVIWASRYHGDGYGFDILSYDSNKGKEKAIEVKSGLKPSFSITKTEFNLMHKSGIKDFDFYVYKFTYDEKNNVVYKKVLLFDKDLGTLVDVENDIVYDFDIFDNNYRFKPTEEKVLVRTR